MTTVTRPTPPHDTSAPVAQDRMYIDGQWCRASDGGEFELVNPATGATISRIPIASRADLDRALDAVQRGFESWRWTGTRVRADGLTRTAELLRERADSIAAVMSEEQGKVLTEARAEVEQSAGYFSWYAEECRRMYGRIIPSRTNENRLEVTRAPIGPVAAFTAWNFPASLPARKIAPALAAGCAIIVKPAEQTPRTAMALVQACHDAGIPPGVVNLVTGEPAAISRHLCASGVIRKITLTGSVPVGRELIRLSAEHIVPLSLELGGHAPVLVFPDADIDSAATLSAQAKFRNCGQVCISPSRFFVHEEVFDAFRAAFVDATRRLVVGPPTKAGVDVGPLADQKRISAVEGILADAVERGAVVETGGHRVAGFPDGFFFEPTLLTHVTDDMAVMREEPFGPIAPIATFASTQEAIARANATGYGLAAYVFTNALDVVHAATTGIEAGMVGVNHFGLATAEAPFGGTKLSGYGREGGTEGLEAYTYAKYVNVRTGAP